MFENIFYTLCLLLWLKKKSVLAMPGGLVKWSEELSAPQSFVQEVYG